MSSILLRFTMQPSSIKILVGVRPSATPIFNNMALIKPSVCHLINRCRVKRPSSHIIHSIISTFTHMHSLRFIAICLSIRRKKPTETINTTAKNNPSHFMPSAGWRTFAGNPQCALGDS